MTRPARRCATCGEQYGERVLFCPRDGQKLGASAALVDDPHVGRRRNGYEIQRLIGAGAMARVYAAEALGRPVALKILHRELAADPSAVARFRREAHVGTALKHPHLTALLDSGTLESAPDGSGGEPFLALEYLDGVSLRSALAATGPLSVARSVHVVGQVAEAIGAAHVHGIVHRDLKPENIMLIASDADPDFVKVLDFGAARTHADADFQTREGAVLGSPRYLSPEGAQGLTVGPAADVYSLATVLYECLAGRTPFEGESAVAVLVQQVSAPPPPLRGFAPAARVAPDLADFVESNLAKSPESRAPNAVAFARALRRLASAVAAVAALAVLPRVAIAAETRTQGVDATTPIETSLSVHGDASTDPEIMGPRPARGFRALDRPTGMAEVGFGWLTLPGAEVCVERTAAGCRDGDTSLVVDVWQLYRQNLRFAFGAGLMLGLVPTTDAPRKDPEGITRDHTRRYLTIEAAVRYYPYVAEGFELWVGLTGGLVVVSDRFEVANDNSRPLIGPRGVTIRTEGGTIGLGVGTVFALSTNWSIGAALRGGTWVLPETPATDPLEDEASLTGRNSIFALGVNLGYRITL